MDNLPRSISRSQPSSRQTIGLGKSLQDDQIGVIIQHFKHGNRGKISISFIQNYYSRKVIQQRGNRFCIQPISTGIVGGTKKKQLGPVIYRLRNGLQIRLKIWV